MSDGNGAAPAAPDIGPDYHASAATLATVLGVTRARVTQFYQAGMPRREDGRYHVPSCVAWRIEQLLDSAAGGESLEALRTEQSEHWRLRNARLREELLEVDEGAGFISQLFAHLVAGLEGLEARLRAARAMTPEHREQLRAELHTTREDLAYQVRKFLAKYSAELQAPRRPRKRVSGGKPKRPKKRPPRTRAPAARGPKDPAPKSRAGQGT